MSYGTKGTKRHLGHRHVEEFLYQPGWASPGEWIRTSTLKRIAMVMGHFLPEKPRIQELPVSPDQQEDDDELNEIVTVCAISPPRSRAKRMTWDLHNEVSEGGEDNEAEESEGGWVDEE